MRGNLKIEGIELTEEPIKTPGKVGVVERYHAQCVSHNHTVLHARSSMPLWTVERLTPNV